MYLQVSKAQAVASHPSRRAEEGVVSVLLGQARSPVETPSTAPTPQVRQPHGDGERSRSTAKCQGWEDVTTPVRGTTDPRGSLS